MNQAQEIIPKLKFSEPRRNLPLHRQFASAEDLFTIRFARAYISQAAAIHARTPRKNLILAREIPVNGYGIADLLAIAWQKIPRKVYADIESFVNIVHPCTRAFECKLSDWRRAMSQAARYRFFANQAIVVLPDEKLQSPTRMLLKVERNGRALWQISSGSI